MNTSSKQVIDLALQEVGTREKPTNDIKYNAEYYKGVVNGSAFAWCAVFIWWLFHSLGADKLYYDGNKTASCTSLYAWALKNKLTVPVSDLKPGDIVFYDWDSSGDCDHCGIVVSMPGDGYIYTVEGNYNNSVAKVKRKPADISCAYRPKYTEDHDSLERIVTDLKKIIIRINELNI